MGLPALHQGTQPADGLGGTDGHNVDGGAVVHLFHLGLLIKPLHQSPLVIGQVDGHPLGPGVQPVPDGLQQPV